MKRKNNKLKGAIIAKYGTYRAFADEVGIGHTQLSSKLNGYRPITAPERKLFAILLDTEEGVLFDGDVGLREPDSQAD